MKKFFYFLVLIFLLQPQLASTMPSNALADSSCTNIYLPKNADDDLHIKVQTENLIRYLSLLIDSQHIGTQHLQNMLINAEQGKLNNPITEKQARSASVLRIIYDGIQSVLDKNNIDVGILKKWSADKLSEKAKEEERRNVSNEQTKIAAIAANFNLIKPGHFVMGGQGKTTLVKITVPFEMMQTLFTQSMWARIQVASGEVFPEVLNPSEFQTGFGSMLVDINGVKVQMKPDHPVEQVTRESARDLINKINVLSASDKIEDQNLLESIFVGHQKGDHYDLPTEAQWEFVLRNLGQSNERFVDTNSEAELLKYAWFSKNANGETHAVAQLQPRIVDGRAFFDLEGNVRELVRDAFQENLPGGIDPFVEFEPGERYSVLRGGGYLSNANSLEPSYRFKTVRNSMMGTSETGFRLVRTRATKGPRR